MKWTIYVVACATLVACAPSLPPVGLANLDAIRETRPWANMEGLQEGRALFASRCGSCHGLPNPSGYPSDRWPQILDWMAPKAKVDSTQARKILDWVLSAR